MKHNALDDMGLSMFWSSVVLTGNETDYGNDETAYRFWSSVVLTGNETSSFLYIAGVGFGAVSF